MKRLKTDELGLHPLTLQDLAFMQGSYFEGFKELIKSIAGTTPCILWGLEESYRTTGVFPFIQNWADLSAGSIWDGNEIVPHLASSINTGSTPISPVWRMHYDENPTVLPPVTYRNGVSKSVYREKYAYSDNVVIAGNTIVLSSLFRLDAILKSRLGIDAANNQISNIKGASNLVASIKDIVGVFPTVPNGFAFQSLADLVENIEDHKANGTHDWAAIDNNPFLASATFNINNVPTSSQMQIISWTHNLGHMNYSALISLEHYDPSGTIGSVQFKGATAIMQDRANNSCNFRVFIPNLTVAISGFVGGYLKVYLTAR